MSTPERMKPCPYCGKTIKATAVKCRFCGKLAEAKDRAPPRQAGPSGDDQFLIPVNVSGWSIVACYGGLIGMSLPVVGLVFAVPAVVCGIVALRRRAKTVDIRAILGLVFGIIAVTTWGSGVVLFVLLRSVLE
jgi:predicted branched-subunit amino acid permease